MKSKKESKKHEAKEKALINTKNPNKFIKKLEHQKTKRASFDNGTWKPSHKGETFEQALDRSKWEHED